MRRKAEPLLTVKELAGHLKLSTRTIYNWISAGKVPHIKLGHSVRFRETIINELLTNIPSKTDEIFEKECEG